MGSEIILVLETDNNIRPKFDQLNFAKDWINKNTKQLFLIMKDLNV